MANEWEKVELYGQNNDGDARRFSVLNSDSITKGTLLSLADARTASAALVGDIVWAGVASMDKEASDGSTSITAWTNGVFEATASGAISIGQPVIGCESNKVKVIPETIESSGALAVRLYGAGVLGYAMETASDGEVINIRLRL